MKKFFSSLSREDAALRALGLRRDPLAGELIALEPRMVFDGAGLAVATEAAKQAADTTDAAKTDATKADAAKSTVDSAAELAKSIAAAAAPPPPAPVPQEVVFIDSRVSDIDAFKKASGDNRLVIVVDSQEDGIAKITETLKGLHDVSAVHIIGHGKDGAFELGADWIGVEALKTHEVEIHTWANALAKGADILLYGCDIAKDSSGTDFIKTLAAETGADVAASKDAVGKLEQGADWSLETKTGDIEAKVIAPESYQAQLAENVLVFIDKRIADWQKFADAANANGYHVFYFDNAVNPLATMDNAIEATSGITQIHIISGGNKGGFIAGNMRVDSNVLNLANYRSILSAWNSKLSVGADILIYGNNVASDNGAFIENFRSAIGSSADLAASTDATGASTGANWTLEVVKVTSARQITSTLIRPATFTGDLAPGAFIGTPFSTYLGQAGVTTAWDPTISSLNVYTTGFTLGGISRDPAVQGTGWFIVAYDETSKTVAGSGQLSTSSGFGFTPTLGIWSNTSTSALSGTRTLSFYYTDSLTAPTKKVDVIGADGAKFLLNVTMNVPAAPTIVQIEADGPKKSQVVIPSKGTTTDPTPSIVLDGDYLAFDSVLKGKKITLTAATPSGVVINRWSYDNLSGTPTGSLVGHVTVRMVSGKAQTVIDVPDGLDPATYVLKVSFAENVMDPTTSDLMARTSNTVSSVSFTVDAGAPEFEVRDSFGAAQSTLAMDQGETNDAPTVDSVSVVGVVNKTNLATLRASVEYWTGTLGDNGQIIWSSTSTTINKSVSARANSGWYVTFFANELGGAGYKKVSVTVTDTAYPIGDDRRVATHTSQMFLTEASTPGGLGGSNLLAWYDQKLSGLTSTDQMADLSGNNNPLSANTDSDGNSSAPDASTDGKYLILAPGKYLNIPKAITPTSVVYVGDLGATQSLYASNAATSAGLGFTRSSSTSNIFLSSPAVTQVGSASTPATSPYVASASFSGSSVDSSINGAAGSTASTATAFTSGLKSIGMASTDTSANRLFGELIAYSSALTAEQQAILQNALAQEYGLSMANGTDLYAPNGSTSDYGSDVAGLDRTDTGSSGSSINAGGLKVVDKGFLNANGSLFFGNDAGKSTTSWKTGADGVKQIAPTFAFDIRGGNTSTGAVDLTFDLATVASKSGVSVATFLSNLGSRTLALGFKNTETGAWTALGNATVDRNTGTITFAGVKVGAGGLGTGFVSVLDATTVRFASNAAGVSGSNTATVDVSFSNGVTPLPSHFSVTTAGFSPVVQSVTLKDAATNTYTVKFSVEPGVTKSYAYSYVYGSQTDTAGQKIIAGADAANSVAIDRTPPAVQTLAPETLTSARTVSLAMTEKVTSAPAVTVVDSAGNPISGFTVGALTTTDGGLTWSFSITPPAGSSGTYKLKVSGYTDASGNQGADFTTTSAIYDTAAPTVTGVVIDSAVGAQNNRLNAGDKVKIKVSFSESVNVTGAPTVAIDIGGVSKIATYESGSGGAELIFSYTIESNLTDANGISIPGGSLHLGASDTIRDLNGNSAVVAFSAVSDNASYLVDTTAPTVSMSTNAVSIGQSQTATITFHASEAVTGLTEDDFTATNGTLSELTLIAGSTTDYTATFTPTAAGAATIKFKTGGAYQDLAGNAGAAATPDLAITVLDNTFGVRTVALTGGTGQQGAYFNAGDTITATVTFSDTVTVNAAGGSPILKLNVGGVSRNATYVGASGKTATFTYTVAAADTDANGVSIDANALVANGATFKNPINDSASLTFPSVADDANYIVDNVKPNAPGLTLGSGVADGATAAEATAAGGVVKVTAENAARVTVTFTNGLKSVSQIVTGAGATPVAVTLSSADLTWLGDGVISVSAGATDLAGNSSDAGTTSFTLDSVKPDQPGLALGTGVANGATAAEATATGGVVTVAAESGASIAVTFSNGGRTVTKSVTGAGATPVAVTLSSADLTTLGDGLISVSAIATDAAGNPSDAGAISFTLDTTKPAAPSLSLGTGVPGGATAAEATAASGVVNVTAETGAVVTVTFSNGAGTVTKTVTGAGATPVPVTLSSADLNVLRDGLINVSAIALDSAGNTSDAGTTSFTLDTTKPGAPLLALGAGVANGATAAEATATGGVVTVTGESGASIAVTFSNGGRTVTKTVTGAGATPVAVALTSADLTTLGEGAIAVSAVATDGAGNPSDAGTTGFTLDTIKPTAPTLALGAGVSDGATAAEATAATGVVSVSAESGSSVVVTFSNAGKTVTKTVTGAGATPVAVTLTSADLTTLGDGAISVSAVATDTAGNPSNAGTASFVLNTARPNTPALSLGAGVSDGATAAEATASTGVVTVTAASGSRVAVVFSNGVQTVTKSVTGAGATPVAVTLTSADLTTLGDGAISVSAVATDGAGNSSDAGVASFTLDTARPGLLTLSPPTDTGASNADRVTRDATFTVSNLEALATWQYSTDGGAQWSAAQPASTTGSATFNAPEGVYAAGQIRVRQTDRAGNVSAETPTTQNFTVDLTKPAAVIFLEPTDTGASATDWITSDRTIRVTNLEASATLQYSLDGGRTWTSTPAGQTSFDLPDGSYPLGAANQPAILMKQVDLAGNESTPVGIAHSLTIDTTAPAKPSFALAEDTGRDATDGVTRNPKVNVAGVDSAGGWEYSTDGGSSWSAAQSASVTSFDLPTAVNASAVYAADRIQVRQRDMAGNVSDAAKNAAPITVDRIAPAASTLVFVNDTGASNSDSISNDGRMTVNVEVGGYLDYALNGGPVTRVTNDGPTGVVAIDLPEGAYLPGQISFNTYDRAGNASSNGSSNAVTIVVDKTAPAKPALALADDTGVSATDGVSNNPTVNVSGVETSATWEYSTDGGKSWSAAQPASKTSFTLADGVFPADMIQVRQTDRAGNISNVARNAAPVVIDRVVATPAFRLANDTGSLANDNLSKDGAIAVSGLESGATWQYSTDGGATWKDGVGSSFTLGEGAYAVGSVMVRQTDRAGNSAASLANAAAITIDLSTQGSLDGYVDTTLSPVTVAEFSTPAGATQLSFVGTAEKGAAVELFTRTGGSETKIGSTTADLATGRWLLQPTTGLVEAVYTMFVRVSDTAGNTFDTPAQTLTISLPHPPSALPQAPVVEPSPAKAIRQASDDFNPGSKLVAESFGAPIVSVFDVKPVKNVVVTPDATAVSADVTGSIPLAGGVTASVPLVEYSSYLRPSFIEITVSVNDARSGFVAARSEAQQVDAVKVTPTATSSPWVEDSKTGRILVRRDGPDEIRFQIEITLQDGTVIRQDIRVDVRSGQFDVRASGSAVHVPQSLDQQLASILAMFPS